MLSYAVNLKHKIYYFLKVYIEKSNSSTFLEKKNKK